MTEWADRLCKNLGTTNDEITTILRDALDAKQLDNLFEINDKMNSLKQKDESAILQIISIHLLVILEKPDAALKFAQKLLLVDSSDPQSCILTALVQIRQAKYVFSILFFLLFFLYYLFIIFIIILFLYFSFILYFYYFNLIIYNKLNK